MNQRGSLAVRSAVLVMALILCIVFNGVAVAASASEEVEFQSAGVSLAGTLFYPQSTPPIAAVILVHGSGQVERMEPLARLLVSDGFAVLTYDKRGVGKSGGVYEEQDNISAVNLNLLAEDAAAALNVVVNHRRLAGIPSGFVGISQAGWIVPIAATKVPAPSFFALWSGPVCTVSEELHFSSLAEGDSDFWRRHSAQEVNDHMKSVRYRSDDFDPRTSLSSISIPGLWIFGGQDNSIPVELSIVRLKGLIDQGRSNFQYKTFPDYGHNLADSPKQLSYQFVVAWIKSTVSRLRPSQQPAAADVPQVAPAERGR